MDYVYIVGTSAYVNLNTFIYSQSVSSALKLSSKSMWNCESHLHMDFSFDSFPFRSPKQYSRNKPEIAPLNTHVLSVRDHAL